MTGRGGWALKRGIDAVASGLALLFLLPALAPLLLLIALDDAGPPLFRQMRAGRHGRRFELLKLRTMRFHDQSPEELGQVETDHALITPLGSVLRRFKLDELPQLINVLRGDMSLVGPRPTLPEQADSYDAFERRRLDVAPGLTGWAQVNGNIRLGWRDRIALDVWYVDHWSLWLDMTILARTLGVVLFGERANNTALEEALTYANGTGRRG
jgi:lipopolysaccharide/colanic/teichoic acid biosynthesis glycosyltransferase